MADHSKDKSSEDKTQDEEKTTPSSLVFQDEDEDIPDFDRTINLGTPLISSPDDHSFDSTIQFSSMDSLFEEESAKQVSGTGKTEAKTKQPGSPDDNLNDENSPFTNPAKKIELTEADYADTDTVASETPQPADDIPEDINEPEDAINSQAITIAANEAHALQDKPEITVKDETPAALPAKESAALPAVQPRTGLATALGLIGIIAASGALWMIFDLSDRTNQLELQLAAVKNNRIPLNQRKDIVSLNQRINELGTQFAAHLKTIAQAKEASPVPDVKKPSTPAPVLTKPVVTAIKPAVDSGHGPWVINLTSLSHAAAANNEVTRLKGLGIRAESIKVMAQGKIWYRIRVPGFASAEEADRQRKILGNRLGIRDTWIGKR